ncbi:GMC family oxidoreductase [Actinomadura atramentaria]|uniref:GMC family oxidoreductase n=1 Tax=Actinomadura atramentaria TaxID=1990 RepID=UPI0003721595|nr:GMC family oxidoreductase [Actinomadura atramentaria]
MPDFTETQLAVLRAVVDTAVPPLDRADDPHGYWAASGTSLGADTALLDHLDTQSAEENAALAGLLDGLASIGFQHQGRATREGMLATFGALAPDAAAGIAGLRALACVYAHSVTGADGRNPLWAQYGYPGPQIRPPDDEPYITPYAPADGETLAADVVVVGSGAGGGTVAGVLAAAGRRVVVLEAGGATSERDYDQLEYGASRTMLYRRGVASTADGNAGLLAGRTLGGGTTVNWHHCLRPTDAVRREWAAAGITGADTAEFDRHLDAVAARINATDACSDYNGPHRRLAEGAAKLGWSVKTALRNVDPATYDPVAAGYTQFGDPSGSKRGTLNTYLRDAFDHGAKILTDTEATEILTSGGRASGVRAVHRDPATGEERRITVHARDVVVAGGALETPALLLRSGLGGPAVGQGFFLHPCAGVFAVYPDRQDPWWGPPQAAVLDEFRDLGDGYGFIIEGSHLSPGIIAFQLARGDGAEHKEVMADLGRLANLVMILREHTGGHVDTDESGTARHHYPFDDPRDVDTYHRGVRALAELHLAAGAESVWVSNAPVLRRGDDLDAWAARLREIPIGRGGLPIGTAHQMGGARIGADPAASVAGPTGELHDTPGVWIGDTSAFPTPSGANPMLTCMALAHRTAENILARGK